MNLAVEQRAKIYGLAITLAIYAVKILLWPREGLKITPDSSAYLEAAQVFIETGTFSTDFLHWPPLYPLVLSLVSLFESDLIIAASYLNATILLILLLGYWSALSTSLPSGKLVCIGMILVAFSPPVDLIFSYVWSEPLFLLASFYCLYFWARFLASRKRLDLIAAGLLLMMCLLSRHTGIVVPLVMLASVAVYLPSFRTWSLARLIAAGLLASVPYIYWIYRTWVISATLTGPRITEENNGLIESLALFSRSIAHWSFPHSYFIDTAYIATGITVTLMAIVITVTVTLSAGLRRNIGKIAAPQDTNANKVLVFVFGWFALFYSGFLVLSVSIFRVDPIGDRLMSSLVFPMVYVLLYATLILASYLDKGNARIKNLFIALGSLWFLAWLVAPNQINGLLMMWLPS